MGEASRRKKFVGAGGLVAEKIAGAEAPHIGLASTEEIAALVAAFDLPMTTLADWPDDHLPLLDCLCIDLVEDGWPDPLIHRGADGTPVVLSTRRARGTMEMLVVDRITLEDSRRRVAALPIPPGH